MSYKHIIRNSVNKTINTMISDLDVLPNETLVTFGNINDLEVSVESHDAAAIQAESDFNLHKKQQDEALAAAWEFITPYFDQPAFIQMSDWKYGLGDQHTIHPYIEAIEAWKSAIMFEYLLVKKQYIWMGLEYDLDYSFVGSPPCKFTDLFLLANPALQAYAAGWSAPDITNYAPGTRQNPKPILF